MNINYTLPQGQTPPQRKILYAHVIWSGYKQNIHTFSKNKMMKRANDEL